MLLALEKLFGYDFDSCALSGKEKNTLYDYWNVKVVTVELLMIYGHFNHLSCSLRLQNIVICTSQQIYSISLWWLVKIARSRRMIGTCTWLKTSLCYDMSLYSFSVIYQYLQTLSSAVLYGKVEWQNECYGTR